MTFRGLDGVSFGRLKGVFLLASAVLLPALGACATATIEDAVPQSTATAGPAGTETAGEPVGTAEPAAATATQTTTIESVADPSALSAGPIDTDQYPNLNIVPEPAAPQMTAAERNALKASLEAKKQQLAAGPAAANDQRSALSKIARTHADEALREIEASE